MEIALTSTAIRSQVADGCHAFAYQGEPTVPEGMAIPAYRRTRGGRRARAARRRRAWVAAGWPLSRRPGAVSFPALQS
jgi:hypothetical protein